MKTTKEKIEVMQHFVDGGEVEVKFHFEVDDEYVDLNKEEPDWNWGDYDYRKKEEPECVPFDISDAENLLGRKVKDGATGQVGLILGAETDGVFFNGNFHPYEYLRRYFSFLDGTPCGKLKIN